MRQYCTFVLIQLSTSQQLFEERSRLLRSESALRFFVLYCTFVLIKLSTSQQLFEERSRLLRRESALRFYFVLVQHFADFCAGVQFKLEPEDLYFMYQ